jgi:hypothetical protein
MEMQKLIERVTAQIKDIVEGTVEREINDNLGGLLVQSELYRAIGDACQRKSKQIAAEVDYMRKRAAANGTDFP